MNILILKGFNNYFNRIALKYPDLATYQEASEEYFNFANVNFNPADGVSTELIIGNETQQIVENEEARPLDWEFSGAPDYLICYDTEIKSRWYVIECDRTRNGQYRLLLKRDVIVDNYDDVVSADCFIEKGVVESTDDPAIYNKEPIETNQIKTAEFLLTDETQCGWVVGYVAKDRWDGSAIVDTQFTSTDIPDDKASDQFADETYSSFAEFETAHADIIGTLGQVNKKNLLINLWLWKTTFWNDKFCENIVKIDLNNRNPKDITFTETGNKKKKNEIRDYDGIRTINPRGASYITPSIYSNSWDGRVYKDDDVPGYLYGFYSGLFLDDFVNFIDAQIASNTGVKLANESTLQKLNEYVNKNKIVKIADRYYEVIDEYSDLGKEKIKQDNAYFSVGGTPYNETISRLNFGPYEGFARGTGQTGDKQISWTNTPNDSTFKIEYSITLHKLTLREKFAGLRAKMPLSPKILNDAPYYMFAIPFSDDLAIWEGDTLHCTTKKSVAINAAQAIATKNGAGTVYDVQLLPYCPIRDAIKTTQISERYILDYPTTFENSNIIPGHQYVLSKKIGSIPLNPANLVSGVKTVFRTDGAIYVKCGNNNSILDNDTPELYKKIEFICSRNRITAINLYWGKTDLLPQKQIDYATYADGDDLIGLYFTDQPIYGYQEGLLDDLVYYTPEEEKPSHLGLNIWAMLRDYIYHENYFLSKVDISNCITSDIVKVEGGQEVPDSTVSTIFWATDSKFTFDRYLDDYYLLQEDGNYKADPINNVINEHIKKANTVQDVKFKNQSEMLRIASPNYSNFFDMNVERNKGIELINVDCTYRPYSPYIHLNPNFKGLYGQDFDDIRGLICGGDFSIALTTDAWANYQLQNKNYQAIFDRQIQNIETTNAIQNNLDKWQAGAGALTGAGTGAAAGAMVGGPWGAVAGAVVGGAASIMGGVADVSIKKQLRDLQVSASKDIFSMQLENIKALPQGLAKTNYLTNNNKLFPFLEFYTCTAVEEQAVRDFMRLNGMTINRVGTISDFQGTEVIPYIKAKLLRINTVEDAHQVEEIAKELDIGYYIPEPETIIPDENEGE